MDRYSSFRCCSVTKSCPSLHDPMGYSIPGLPVPHHLQSSCLLNWWCHPTISSSVTLFSFCLQSFQWVSGNESFPMSHLFTSGIQSIGASASASVLPKSIQGWLPLVYWLVWSPCFPRDSSPAPQFEHINSSALCLLIVQLSHPYMTTGKTIALTIQNFFSKMMSFIFNTV